MIVLLKPSQIKALDMRKLSMGDVGNAWHEAGVDGLSALDAQQASRALHGTHSHTAHYTLGTGSAGPVRRAEERADIS